MWITEEDLRNSNELFFFVCGPRGVARGIEDQPFGPWGDGLLESIGS